jgi:hypothetical protein
MGSAGRVTLIEGSSRLKGEAACFHLDPLYPTSPALFYIVRCQHEITRLTIDCRWSLSPSPARRS